MPDFAIAASARTGRAVRAPALFLLLGLGLAGCGQSLATDAQEATAAYGIAKGVAAVAEQAQPALAPTVTAIEAQADPIAASVSSATAPTLTSLATNLLVATAQVIHVEPNAAAAAATAAAASP